MVKLNGEKPDRAGEELDRAGRRPPSCVSRTVYSLSEEETVELGRSLGQGIDAGELILLEGELGAGKTAFTRGIAVGLGIAPEDVSSPTFTLVQEYCGGRLPLFHVDLYRVERAEQLESLGLEELLSTVAVVVVEWAEKLPAFYRLQAITVRFHDAGEGSRRIEIFPGMEMLDETGGDADA